MERKHEQALRRKYSDEVQSKKIVCLHIEDQFQFMDAELIAILRSRVSEYLLIE
ncbi:MAG: hypothetical protein P4L53_21575 [Candidatus Obscuribacterales bacterium]|nr:hypothetical protein [Candidatus Obscuribacterales bacterium]